MSSLLMQKITEEFSERLIYTYSVMPGSSSKLDNQTSDVVVEPYNSVFCLNSLVNDANGCSMVENSCLYRICEQNLKMKSVCFKDINYLISQAISATTSTLRYKNSQNNTDLRKLLTNLVPFNRLHFLQTSLAPLVPRGSSEYYHLNAHMLTQMVNDPKFAFTNYSGEKYGKTMT